MAFELLKKPKHGSLPWLKQRWKDSEGRCVFGASDVPVLMNSSPWKSRAELYVDKRTEPKVREETMAMRKGNLLEPVLLSEAEKMLGVKIITPTNQFKKDRLVVSFDGLPFDDIHIKNPEFVVEAKTTASKVVNGLEDISEDWRWQAWAQSEIFDGVPVFFIVLDKHQNISLHELPDNPSARNRLVEETEVFGAMVDRGDPMGQLINDLDAEQIASFFKSEDISIEMGADATKWVELLQLARENKNDAEKQEKLAKDNLARFLQGAQVGLIDGIDVVSWKETAGKMSLDVKALQANHPEIFNRYQKQNAPYRTMRLLNKKSDT